MRILLIGEYSRLHNSLKEGLENLGHKVTIVSTGDYFKNYPSDIKIIRRFENGILKKIKVGLFKIFKIDIASYDLMRQFFNHKINLCSYDVVQLINESPLGLTPNHEKKVISFLKQNNKKLFLLSCGTDYISVKYCFDQKLNYSILTPYFEGRMNKKNCSPILKYLKPDYEKLHFFVYEKINGVIASDLDYHIPLKNQAKYFGLLPNPINTNILNYETITLSSKIIIFHGINRNNFLKKGNDFFEKALEIIQKKYPTKVEIIITENVPYAEYIQSYNRAHILLDMVYAYDQGYNALEAMAKGKVVFTGAEKEFMEYYQLTERVCVNALPDVDALVQELSFLIENPNEIVAMSKRARAFIEKEHHYITVAQKYVDVWTKN
jgi:glycosyltransferase involved in cell wall biosynthesis